MRWTNDLAAMRSPNGYKRPSAGSVDLSNVQDALGQVTLDKLDLSPPCAASGTCPGLACRLVAASYSDAHRTYIAALSILSEFGSPPVRLGGRPRVYLERQRDIGVPQPPLRRLHVDTGSHHGRRPHRPEIVEAQPGNTGRGTGFPPPCPPPRRLVQLPARQVREHQGPAVGCGQPSGGEQGGDLIEQPFGSGQPTTSREGLRIRQLAVAAQLLGHGDRPVQEVEAVHRERRDLTPAQSEHGSKPDHGAVVAEPVRHRGQLVDLEGRAVHQLSSR